MGNFLLVIIKFIIFGDFNYGYLIFIYMIYLF